VIFENRVLGIIIENGTLKVIFETGVFGGNI
jgi:hypothetical protein